ncbi:MAG: FAD-dependent oxidoreductase, partial [Pseudomonadota bacterium]
MAASKIDCVIRGAGIIGLSCALGLAQRGAQVILVEPRWPPRGASWAAAGMIAPAFEAAGRAGVHAGLFEACLQSAQMWPDWSARLEVLSGMSSGYSPEASIALAVDKETEAELNKIRAALGLHGLAREALEENDLPKAAINGLRLPTDTQVDNRKTMAALISVCEGHERIEVIPEWSNEWGMPQLITAGWETQGLLPHPLPIYPLSGQMVSLERGAGDPQVPVRCGALYIVPKDDRIIVGATVEKDVV